jgi:SagB-type dehydrogenase family enzyme
MPEEKFNVSKSTTFINSPVAREVYVLLPPDFSSGTFFMQALKDRKSSHAFSSYNISDIQLSSILWAANGMNRNMTNSSGLGMRTAPSVKNFQEIEVYVFILSGIYQYDASNHHLKLVRAGDYRKDCGMQPFFAEVPLALCLVANFSKMGKFDEKKRNFYSGTDAGYVSQNIYLYCASEGLATTACGLIDRKLLQQLLFLDNAKAMLSHPVGGL